MTKMNLPGDVRPLLVALAFFACLTGYVAAPARAQNAPADVLAVMPKGAISLRYEAVPFGSEKRGFLHLYCVPKARSSSAPIPPEPGHAKDPIKRADIYPGVALESSPFFLDIWGAGSDGTKMSRLHTFRFTEEGDVAQIYKKWLRPAQKTGPILLMDFGATHWHAWYVFTFPNGFNGKTAFMQRFLWGGEGEGYLTQQFTKTDKRGFLQIDQENQQTEAQGVKRATYFWDGARFTNPQERWFVVVGSHQTRAEADAFTRETDKFGETETLRSDRFGLLKPGLWVTVAARFRTKREAEELAAQMGQRPEWRGAYAKKAF